ncbi:hypothetical protein SBI67_04215 [Mycolicibacterium sp. 120266]|uniref:hypothetical protein n=1 Tax=Mycolicibacterium sp. 120266 TaxID=3090601 RepID=UPI00299E0F33|nr:hypothetical protein [Mycolicibacterium sp. 120266]MDX1871315.1 hypothetical protein [Mycolicibacterium sp. 120266]
MRPYVTAGVALVGASVIAITPIAAHPTLPQMHMPQVQLTASSSIDNPINVFKPVVDDAGAWVNETLHTVLANPLPILRQIVDNQLYTARQVLDAAKAAGSALGQLGAGLPATLKAVGAKLSTGDVNGAIDALLTAGLQPILNLLSNPWTALQPALERPFKVAQALIPALYDSGLSFLVGVVVSTVGIGFDTGTTPFIKQIVTSTQAVLDSLKTLNPVKVINAVQHGIADVLQNAVAQAKAFTEQTFPYIGAQIMKALQAGLPTTTPPATAAVAAAVPTAAATVTLAVDATGAVPAVTTAKDATGAAVGTPAEATGATESAATQAETDTEVKSPTGTTTETIPETTPKATTEPTTKESSTDTTPADSVAPATKGATDTSTKPDASTKADTSTKAGATTKEGTDATATKGTKGSGGSVTRDSIKAEPGSGVKSGGTHASTGGSSTSAADSAAGADSAKAGAAAGSASGSTAKAGSDAGSGSE